MDSALCAADNLSSTSILAICFPGITMRPRNLETISALPVPFPAAALSKASFSASFDGIRYSNAFDNMTLLSCGVDASGKTVMRKCPRFENRYKKSGASGHSKSTYVIGTTKATDKQSTCLDVRGLNSIVITSLTIWNMNPQRLAEKRLEELNCLRLF